MTANAIVPEDKAVDTEVQGARETCGRPTFRKSRAAGHSVALLSPCALPHVNLHQLSL